MTWGSTLSFSMKLITIRTSLIEQGSWGFLGQVEWDAREQTVCLIKSTVSRETIMEEEWCSLQPLLSLIPSQISTLCRNIFRKDH